MNDTCLAWRTFWLAAATIFMVSLDATVVVAAFPALKAYFRVFLGDSIMVFLAFYMFFNGVWHYSQSLAGMAATPGPLLATVCAIIVSKKQVVWGRRWLLTLGGVLFALSNLWLQLRIDVEPDYFGTWFPGQMVGGIAIGLMVRTLAGVAVEGMQADSLGVGSAVNNAIRQLGSSLGVALTIALAGSAASNLEPFRHVYLCLAAAGGLIAMLANQLSSKNFG